MDSNRQNLINKIKYRAQYRGTKEMDLFVYKFVNEIVENLNLEDLGGICFNSDIYSIKHENLKTRIYKT